MRSGHRFKMDGGRMARGLLWVGKLRGGAAQVGAGSGPAAFGAVLVGLIPAQIDVMDKPVGVVRDALLKGRAGRDRLSPVVLHR